MLKVNSLMYGGIALAIAGVAVIGSCGDSSTGNGEKGSGGAIGSGGTVGSGGTTANGGATGSGGAVVTPFTCAGTAVTGTTILDTATLTGTGTAAVWTGGIPGGIFGYQAADTTVTVSAAGAIEAKSNMADYDGFGIWFKDCSSTTASGITFKISGTGVTTLTLTAQTNSTTAVDAKNKKGACIPTNPANPWASCVSPSVAVPVTATATAVTINWSDLTGALPAQTAAQIATELLGLQFAFPSKVTGGDADVIVTDLALVP